MTEHPIHTLSPPELRSYARALRETAARMANATVFNIHATRVELQREAELVEGFAARLEEAEHPPQQADASICSATQADCLPDCLAARGGHCLRRIMDALREQAESAKEEQAQTGLADAVAENLAEQGATDMAEDILKARREKARAAFLTGEKPKDIARQLGIPEGSINSWASKYGWRKELAVLQAQADRRASTSNAHSAEVVEQARVMFCIEGLSYAEIGSRLGIPAGTVSGWASKRGWANQRQPREEAPQAAPATAPILPAGFIPLTDAEMAELRETFRKKEFGVAWLMDEWGLPEAYALQIAQQLRDEAARRRAA